MDQYFRASQIYSRPGRPGLIPLGRSQFYLLLHQGRFPEADCKIGDTRLWSGQLIRAAVSNSATIESKSV